MNLSQPFTIKNNYVCDFEYSVMIPDKIIYDCINDKIVECGSSNSDNSLSYLRYFVLGCLFA